ncbi:MAG TPA: four helix bundle protein [Verrucomicrobiae bacterium]|nr:four helix bundle protein [Verrucomicrobiae bacterium]
MTPEELSERLWNFAARVGKLVDALADTRLGRHVAGQLVRCGTSSAPNYDEGCNAESRADFVHKLGVALKEMRETRGWIRFTIKSELQSETKAASLLDECEQLCRILGKSVGTAKGDNGSTDTMTLKDEAIENSQFSILNSQFPTDGLDHLAIVVPDTEAALNVWRDKFGFIVLFSEDVNEGSVRLTHLDLGNTHLQLVQPLTVDHPLQDWLRKNGSGLHHFCLRVDDVAVAMSESAKCGLPTAPAPHQGTKGKRAVFLDRSHTQGVQVELTGA